MTVTFGDSLTETQKVTFTLDAAPDLAGLADLDFSKWDRAFVLCDSALREHWWPRIAEKLSPKIPIKHVEYVEAVEDSKTLPAYARFVDLLASHHCSRADVLIAVGGGVVLDVSAFLASTYMRGLPLVMIPTTLMGQVDAATAGKTCLNTDSAKNLLGTYYLPTYVYNGTATLATNSEHVHRQGLSEVYKYGLLESKRLIELLVQHRSGQGGNDVLLEMEAETIRVRMSIRKRHPLASNLGHTFGHAFEKISKYAVNHGDAIAAGTVLALEFSARHGLVDRSLVTRVADQMRQLGLNTQFEAGMDPAVMTDLMLRDKKSTSGVIGLVLIRDIAEPLITNGSSFYNVQPETMREFLTDVLADPTRARSGHWAALADPDARP